MDYDLYRKSTRFTDPRGFIREYEYDSNGLKVGFVPAILEEAAPSAKNSIALVCGPPIMIKFTLPILEKLGFSDDHVYTTLENRMKCGRCNVGNVYVCKDGPVFTARQVKAMPIEY